MAFPGSRGVPTARNLSGEILIYVATILSQPQNSGLRGGRGYRQRIPTETPKRQWALGHEG
jgi:hypothetical protein